MPPEICRNDEKDLEDPYKINNFLIDDLFQMDFEIPRPRQRMQ